MHIPIPSLPQPATTPPAIVRAFTRQDAAWDRPVFKAPPLDLLGLPALDPKRLAQDLQRIGLVRR